jgi:hypothetical protein
LAYGKKKEDKDSERRMVSLGQSTNSFDLASLRLLCIDATNRFAKSIWPDSLLDPLPSYKEIDAAMLATQSTFKGTLNAVWTEKCRLNAKSAVLEQRKRGLNKLFGKFKHISSVGEKPLDDGTRRLLNLPEEWSRKLSDEDVTALKTISEGMNFSGVVELFLKVRNGACTSLPALHLEALKAMLSMVEERYGCPEWTAVVSTVQLHLDYRCMPGGRPAQEALLTRLSDSVRFVIGSKAETTTAFLVSGVKAHGNALAFRASVIPDTLKHLAKKEACFTSLVLEISPTSTTVKGVLTHQPKPYALTEATHVLGDDFGYCNTSAQAVVRLDQPLDPAFFEAAAAWTKGEAKAYLQSHIHSGEAVESCLHDGQDFMARINVHAGRIDRLRSEIDCIYNRIHRIKFEVCRILDLPVGTLLDLDMATGNDRRLAGLLGKVKMLLEQVGRLKALRRGLYRTIAGIKKAWFGWLGNRKVELARRYHAAVIREDLSLVAKEKLRPGYLGRTFNRMMNNGAKGQYLRAASQKMKWSGIPEAKVPSYYTSSTDVRHGVVDVKQRCSQDRFVAMIDGREMQADLHAALTIALYPLLRPKTQELALVV